MTDIDRLIKNSRFQKRLFLYHIPIVIISLVSAVLIYNTRKSTDIISNVSFSTAYPALALLAATLIVGPLKKLMNRKNPVSADFRRDLGFWAAILSLVHVVFGLQVHLRGRMWLLFLSDSMEFPFIRIDRFGFANYTGLVATFILLLLFATSNDWSLQKLGIRKWKLIQRWNYVLFAVVVLHGILYQVIEKRIPLFIYIFAGISVIVGIMRTSGYYCKRNV